MRILSFISALLLACGTTATAWAADLAPPFAVTVDGVPIDLAGDASFPWVGDFDGDGKLDLLVGQHGREKSIEGHLRIYRNLGGKGEPRLAQPIWFDDKVPTGLIPDL
jgi:FG-GAP repeat